MSLSFPVCVTCFTVFVHCFLFTLAIYDKKIRIKCRACPKKHLGGHFLLMLVYLVADIHYAPRGGLASYFAGISHTEINDGGLHRFCPTSLSSGSAEFARQALHGVLRSSFPGVWWPS